MYHQDHQFFLPACDYETIQAFHLDIADGPTGMAEHIIKDIVDHHMSKVRISVSNIKVRPNYLGHFTIQT